MDANFVNKDGISSKREELPMAFCRCMYVCMPFYVVHYHHNLMKAHHYHKSHQISSLEKMNIIILVFKWETNKSMQYKNNKLRE